MTNKPNDVRVSREQLPCPFCGFSDVKTVTDDGIHFTQCCKCEATGPTGFKRGDEDDPDWNTRAQPADQHAPFPGYPTVPDDRKLPADQQGKTERNQCDGCQAGIPIIRGCHRMGKPSGYSDLMSCTAKLYSHAQPATAKVDDPTPGFTKWFNEHGRAGLQSELGVEELMEGAYAAGCRAKLNGEQS